MSIEMQPETHRPVQAKKGLVRHYYGDIVRLCFVAAGLLLLVTILVDKELLSLYLTIGVVGVLGMVVLAGLTSPRTFVVLIIEAVVAGLAFIFFEYVAIARYEAVESLDDGIFFLRQALALIFLVALYFSVKSIRGMWFGPDSTEIEKSHYDPPRDVGRF